MIDRSEDAGSRGGSVCVSVCVCWLTDWPAVFGCINMESSVGARSMDEVLQQRGSLFLFDSADSMEPPLHTDSTHGYMHCDGFSLKTSHSLFVQINKWFKGWGLESRQSRNLIKSDLFQILAGLEPSTFE